MSNMSYCRFENTLSDLQDCFDNLEDADLSDREFKARKRLIELCQDIVDAAVDEDGDLYEEYTE